MKTALILFIVAYTLLLLFTVIARYLSEAIYTWKMRNFFQRPEEIGKEPDDSPFEDF